MTEKTIANSRVLSKLDDQFTKGSRFFILHGNEVDDQFFQDYSTGIVKIELLLKNYFSYKGFKNQNFINTSGTNKELSSGFDRQQIKDDIGFEEDEDEERDENTNSQNNNQQNSAQQNQQQEIAVHNDFMRAKQQLWEFEKDKDSNIRGVLVLNGFDWVLNFYQNSQDKTTEKLLQIIDTFKTLEKCTVVMIQKKIDTFEKFKIDISKRNVFEIGKASKDEIACTMLNYSFHHPKDLNISSVANVWDIAQSFSTGKKSLTQCLISIKELIHRENVHDISDERFSVLFERPIDEKVSFAKDVILNDKDREIIRAQVERFMDSEEKDFPKGLILTGPPGTGKTHIARGIANDYKCYFMPVRLSDVKGQFVGESAQKTKRLFDEARANAPTIMFVDEADTILTSRGSDYGSGADSFTRDIVNEFLVSMDGAGTQNDRIFILAATNRKHAIDDAIKSRMGTSLEIGLPNKKNMKKMFSLFLDDTTLDEYDWFDSFLNRATGMSGRDINKFCSNLKKEIDEKGIDEKLFESGLELFENRMIEALEKDVEWAKLKRTPSIQFDAVIGYQQEKSRIRKHVTMLLEKDKTKQKIYKENNLQRSGILLYGPPGNGKTLLAQALAGEFHLHFLNVDLNTLIGSSGSIGTSLEFIFQYAEKIANIQSTAKGILLFFDEFDALARQGGNPALRSVFLPLLASLKSKDTNVVLMAATNFRELLDEATIRKGRFDDHILIGYPNEEDGIKILKQFAKKKQDIQIIDLEEEAESFYSQLQKEKNQLEFQNKKQMDNIPLSIADIENGLNSKILENISIDSVIGSNGKMEMKLGK